MARSENNGYSIVAIIAIGLAFGLGLAGLGIGIGLAIAVVKGQIISSVQWVVPVSTVALTGGLTVGVTMITVRGFKQAVKEPYYWLIPILAIFSGSIVDLCKEIYPTNNKIIKAIFGTITLLLFLQEEFFGNKKRRYLEL